jgi:hypothetical protein
MADWLDPEELRTFRAFHRSWLALTARLDQELEDDTGLPRTYLDILWRLRRAPGRAMRTELTEIGETLLGHLDPTKLTTDTGTLAEDAEGDSTR